MTVEMVKLLGGKVGSAFERVFTCLAVAEDELAKADGPVPDGLFKVLRPTPLFEGKTLDVYRSHVRELIARGVALQKGQKADLSAATRAEVLLYLSGASLVAPLNRGGLMLYHHLFEEVFGAEAARKVWNGYEPPREQRKDELLALFHEVAEKVPTWRPKTLEADDA